VKRGVIVKVQDLIDLIPVIFEKNYEIAKKVVNKDFDGYLDSEKIELWIQNEKDFKESVKHVKGYENINHGLTLPEFKNNKLVGVELYFKADGFEDKEEFSSALLHELIHICQNSIYGKSEMDKNKEKYEKIAYANEIHYYYPNKKIKHDYRKVGEKKFTIKF
jgi:hypothetical protein